jgi:DNA-binding response OmpR family regulator
LTPARILLLEDEPCMLGSLAYVLRQEGFCVLEAGDASQAAQVVARERPQIVLVDAALLRRRGEEALAEARRRGSLDGCHVILLIEKDEPDERALGGRIGAEEFVARPFAPTLVARRARELLGSGPTR